MKSEVSIKPQQSQYQFPALYRATVCGAVMLFTDETTAIVVVDSSLQDLGDYCESFANCTNTDYWTRLPSGSQVILTQE